MDSGFAEAATILKVSTAAKRMKGSKEDERAKRKCLNFMTAHEVMKLCTS